MQQENSETHSARSSWTDRHPMGRFILYSFGLSLGLSLVLVLLLVAFGEISVMDEAGQLHHLNVKTFFDSCPMFAAPIFFICLFAGVIMKAIGYVNPQWKTLNGWIRNFVCAFIAGAVLSLLIYDPRLTTDLPKTTTYFDFISMRLKVSLVTGIISAIFAMLFGPLVGLDKLGMKSIPSSGSEP